MYYCGINIAKHKYEAIIVNETGKASLDSVSFYTILKRDRPWQPLPPQNKKVSNISEQ